MAGFRSAREPYKCRVRQQVQLLSSLSTSLMQRRTRFLAQVAANEALDDGKRKALGDQLTTRINADIKQIELAQDALIVLCDLLAAAETVILDTAQPDQARVAAIRQRTSLTDKIKKQAMLPVENTVALDGTGADMGLIGERVYSPASELGPDNVKVDRMSYHFGRDYMGLPEWKLLDIEELLSSKAMCFATNGQLVFVNQEILDLVLTLVDPIARVVVGTVRVAVDPATVTTSAERLVKEAHPGPNNTIWVRTTSLFFHVCVLTGKIITQFNVKAALQLTNLQLVGFFAVYPNGNLLCTLCEGRTSRYVRWPLMLLSPDGTHLVDNWADEDVDTGSDEFLSRYASTSWTDGCCVITEENVLQLNYHEQTMYTFRPEDGSVLDRISLDEVNCRCMAYDPKTNLIFLGDRSIEIFKADAPSFKRGRVFDIEKADEPFFDIQISPVDGVVAARTMDAIRHKTTKIALFYPHEGAN